MADDDDKDPGGTDPGGDDRPGVDEGRIREIVRDVVGELLGDREVDGKEDGGEEPARETPRTAAAVEADTEDRVRAALSKLKNEEDTQSRLKALEDAKAAAEVPPVKQRRAERAMWGSRG